jgi:hypothetical protein
MSLDGNIDNEQIFLNDSKSSPTAALVQRKRSRSTMACVMCHNKKVKCDVATKSPNSKCTNCIHTETDCIIYVRKKRNVNQKKKPSKMFPIIKNIDDSDDNNIKNTLINQLENSDLTIDLKENFRKKSNSTDIIDSINSNLKNSARPNLPKNVSILNSNLNDLEFQTENKYSSKGNIPSYSSSFLTESVQNRYPHLSMIKLDPNLILKENMHDLMALEFGIDDSAHNNFMKEILTEALNKITENYKRSYSLDMIDYQILETSGCFTLPDEETCWSYINNFFEYINPQMPIIDKTNFFETYSDLKNPPSLLLLYSVLFVGAWQKISEADSEDSDEIPISKIFFKRARLLFEYSVESEPIALIQSLLCFTFNCDNMSNLSKNDYYWVRVAITIALQYGFHLKPPSNHSEYTRKIKKRLWWILVFKDRLTAFGYSRPFLINLHDSEHSMLNLNDLKDSGLTYLESIYLVNLVKFGQIYDKISLLQQEITKLNLKGESVLHLIKRCDLIMIKYLGELPKELKFKFNDASTHSFLSIMLLSHYYTLLIVIHRANILRHTADIYPSWAITFQATQVIKMLSDCLVAKNMINKVALLSHNVLTSSGIIMLYHLLNEDQRISKIAKGFFLRILGIWNASFKKFPSCYPMLCVFATIYNSENHLKHVVKSVAPNVSNDKNKIPKRQKTNLNNITKRKHLNSHYFENESDAKNETFEFKPASLKLPDLSFLTNRAFEISDFNNPLKLKSNISDRKFDSLGVDFDKLFTESVFTKDTSFLPKLNLDIISSPRSDTPTQRNKSPESKINISKEFGNPTNNVNIENGYSNILQENMVLSGESFPDINSNQQLQPNVGNFNNANMTVSDNQVPNLVNDNINNNSSDPNTEVSDLDIPVSLWMMQTGWQPKFDLKSSDSTYENASSNPDDQSNENSYYQKNESGEHKIKSDISYLNSYNIMGGELSQSFNNNEMNNNDSWNTRNISPFTYPNKSSDWLNKYAYSNVDGPNNKSYNKIINNSLNRHGYTNTGYSNDSIQQLPIPLSKTPPTQQNYHSVLVNQLNTHPAELVYDNQQSTTSRPSQSSQQQQQEKQQQHQPLTSQIYSNNNNQIYTRNCESMSQNYEYLPFQPDTEQTQVMLPNNGIYDKNQMYINNQVKGNNSNLYDQANNSVQKY